MGRENKYKFERENILINLIKKIGLSNLQNKIKKEDLENEIINEFINSNLIEIKKIYSTSRWRSVYRDDNKNLNIIKNIMREHNIPIIKTDKKIQESDGKRHNYRIYVFEFPDEIKNKL